jgi:hypothetical protein
MSRRDAAIARPQEKLANLMEITNAEVVWIDVSRRAAGKDQGRPLGGVYVELVEFHQVDE